MERFFERLFLICFTALCASIFFDASETVIPFRMWVFGVMLVGFAAVIISPWIMDQIRRLHKSCHDDQ